jgi:hypothetical protein
MRRAHIESLRMKVNVLEELIDKDNLTNELGNTGLKRIRKKLNKYFNV